MLAGQRHSTVAEFVKFCLVGSSGVLLDTAGLVGLVELGGVGSWVGSLISFSWVFRTPASSTSILTNMAGQLG